jgi:hypothetical protein
VYPVERIFYARPGTVGKEFVSTHAEKHKMLIQSVVSLKTIQESMGVKHLHVLSRLLAQCAQGKVLQDKDLNSSDIVATSSP